MSLVNHPSEIPLQSQMRLTRDALIAYQKAMGVVSNNVSNLDTEGYHRRRPILEERESLDSKPGQIGTGVRLQQIQRISDAYAEEQVTFEKGEVGRWDARQQGLKEVEEIFSEIQSFSISNAMREFWNSWEDLANDVDSVPARYNVLQKAENMSAAFHDTVRGLENIRETLNLDLQDIGNRINSLSTSIADYNKEIIGATNRGQSPNTLLDKRDLLIQDLSELTGANVAIDDNNSMTVYIGRNVLVHREDASLLSWIEGGGGGKSGGELVWADNSQTVTFEGGEARGKIDVQGTIIPGAIEELNSLATTLRNQVNELHRSGIGMDGTTGTNFWRNDTYGAIDLQLNDVLRNHPEKVAASTTSSTGDNALAHTMYELQYNKAFVNNSANYSEYYQGIVGNIANEINFSELRYEASEAALEQAKNWQESVSGVSLDEELARMIALQRVYTASGRVLMKLDEMTTIVLLMAR